MRDFRRVVIAFVVGSFVLAALLGVGALLGAEFGETQFRVLLTTAVVGITSTISLCLLTLAGHRLAWVAMVGAVAALVAAGSALVMVWSDVSWESAHWELLWKAFITGSVLACTGAQLALLIALIVRPGSSARLLVLLAATGAAAAIVAAMLLAPILLSSDPGEGYWRLFGVLSIADALGTVLLVAFGAFPRVGAASPKQVEAPLTPAKFYFSK